MAQIGRPTTPGKAGQKSTLSIRATGQLKDKINNAAKANDRSLSQEAELRLERSFHNQALVNEVLEAMFGKPLAATLLTIGRTMDHTGRTRAFHETGTLEGSSTWFDHPGAFDQAVQGATHVLERLRPSGDPKATRLPKSLPKRVRESLAALGIGLANGCFEALTGNPVTRADGEWAVPLRDTLGPRVDRATRQRKKEQDK